MPRRVLPGHERSPRWRANRARVGIGEKHAPAFYQALHIRRMIVAVELGRLRVKRDGRFLPAHVINEEKQKIRLRLLGPRGGNAGQTYHKHCKSFHHPSFTPDQKRFLHQIAVSQNRPVIACMLAGKGGFFFIAKVRLTSSMPHMIQRLIVSAALASAFLALSSCCCLF